MSLTPPPKVQKLQAALHAKAKGSPGYRFYLLYDKVYRRDVLAFAYRCCLANGGAAGVDGQTFEDIEKYGVRTVAGRTGGRTQEEDVSSAAGPAGVHSQAGREAEAVGHSDGSGSCGADGGRVGSWTDLRGRPATGAVCLPAGPQRVGCRPAGPRLAEDGAYGGGRRGPERVLRQHPARRTDEVGGPSRQRSAPAASDQDVAGSAGGRSRRAWPEAADDPQQGRRTGDAARRLRSRRC